MIRRLFRALMRLFPADFRGDFGAEMEETFTDELADAGGAGRRARAWARTTGGMLRTGPRLHLEQAWQDTRYAVRNLRRAPAFTAIAGLALAFGTGASVATFSVADAFLYRPLPFADPDRLVHIWAAEPERGYLSLRASRPEFETWAARNDLFDAAAIFNYTSVELTSGTEPERVPSGAVGANVFDVLGVPPLLGRTFRPSDADPGAPLVVVVSERFWRARLGARDDVVGSTIAIAGATSTVVGVMPASFVFPLPVTELWTPRRLDPVTHDASHRAFQVVARLAQGVSREQAAAALATPSSDLARTHPSLEGRTASVVPLRSALNFADDVMSIGVAAIGLANLLVLLAACANISSLMLGRAARRGREVAIRAAIGASRFRLVRQFLVESLVLAFLGGAGGIVVALWALRLTDAAIPLDLYRVGALALDTRGILVTFLLTGGAAIVFGLLPALRFARVNLGLATRQDSSGARSSLRLQSLLVQAQVGLSVVLLVGTVLVGRSVGALTSVDPGFNSDSVLSFDLVLPSERHAGADAVRQFHADVTARAASLPGVAAATTVNYLPLNHETATLAVRVADAAPADGRLAPEATALWIGPDYFRVMGIPVLQGREFLRTDDPAQPRVAIVNASLARRHWPDGGALGSTIQLGERGTPYTIVGVVGDSLQVTLADAPGDQVFVAMLQQPQTYFRLLARTVGEPGALRPALTAAVHEVDPLLPIIEVRTLRQVVEDSLLPQRSLSLSLVMLGGFALALALFGIYGIVMVYVVDRTREMGIRIALGADRRRIARFVLARSLRLAVVGAGVGLVIAVAASLAAQGLLFGVAAGDPATYAIVAFVVVGIAAAAGAIPAHRAASISPLVAMKE